MGYPNSPIGHSPQLAETRAYIDRGLRTVTNAAHLRDLKRLQAAADNRFKDLDIELINCRRLNHYTQRYHELYQLTTADYRLVSKLLLQAMLMRD